MRRRKLPVTVAAAAAVCALAVCELSSSSTDAPPLTLAAVIRCTDGVFSVINDAGHRPYGVESVTTTGSTVRVDYAVPVAQLAAIQATSDDTYVRSGIAAGVSGGLGYAVVVFADRAGPITPAAACLPGSNVWLTGYGWTP